MCVNEIAGIVARLPGTPRPPGKDGKERAPLARVHVQVGAKGSQIEGALYVREEAWTAIQQSGELVVKFTSFEPAPAGKKASKKGAKALDDLPDVPKADLPEAPIQNVLLAGMPADMRAVAEYWLDNGIMTPAELAQHKKHNWKRLAKRLQEWADAWA